jgi:ribonuclease P protein component
MTPKKNRANTKDVGEIWAKGRFVNSARLTLRYLVSHANPEPKLSFVVPKNTVRLASGRNKLKRRGYQALSPHLSKFRGIVGVFIFNKDSSKWFGGRKTKDFDPLANLEAEILDIQKKLKI